MMRTEWAAGVVSCVLANINRDPKSPPFSPTDFTEHYTPVSVVNQPISLEEAMSNWA